MTYILEKANVLKENRIVKSSILINNEKIEYISDSLARLKFMRTDLTEYVLTPGHVMVNYSFTTLHSFQKFKEDMKEYLLRGCTTLLVICDVKSERELTKKIFDTRHYLLNSPIDYFIGIRIPLKALTPSLIVTCRKKKIPVIIVEIDHSEDILNIPWGWISESFYTYRIPIIPKWNMKQKLMFSTKKNTEIWNEIMIDHRIPTISLCPDENTPLPLHVLKKIGIFPEKGDVRIGGEVDYNLYDANDIGFTVEEKPILDYHKLIPKITVHKGRVIRANSKLYFRPGFGNECIVKKPGFFDI